MKKILLTILLAASVSANAATVSINGTNYEVNTARGTFKDLATTLQSQIWWRNQDSANAFAHAFGPGQGNPLFLHQEYLGILWTGSTYDSASTGLPQFYSTNEQYLFATAKLSQPAPMAEGPIPAVEFWQAPITAVELSQVPIPAAAFMFAPALLGFLGLRRRSKQA